MSDRSKIEWTDATWNPVVGCNRLSPGCDQCYAMNMARRFDKPGAWGEGLTTIRKGRVDWSGKVVTREDLLDRPLHWRKPRRVFVCSTSDLFHHSVPYPFIAKVFWTMMRAPQHTFQVLTKRPDNAVAFFDWLAHADDHQLAEIGHPHLLSPYLPPAWIHIGVSAEDQQRLAERIPYLMHIPAAVRWLSAEPLVGPLDLGWLTYPDGRIHPLEGIWDIDGVGPLRRRCLDWVVVGGESGPGARPMHPSWARTLRDQCFEHDVPFFFKQWGAYSPCEPGNAHVWVAPDGTARTPKERKEARPRCSHGPVEDEVPMMNRGKRDSGRLLDGRCWDEQPRDLREGRVN